MNTQELLKRWGWQLGAGVVSLIVLVVVISQCGGGNGATTTVAPEASDISVPLTIPEPTVTAPPPTTETTVANSTTTTFVFPDAPLLEIDTPQDGDVFDEPNVTFAGRVEPGSTLRVGIRFPVVQDDGAWTVDLDLVGGENVMVFVVTTADRVTRQKRITVFYEVPEPDRPVPGS